jgi:hypothetical protein
MPSSSAQWYTEETANPMSPWVHALFMEWQGRLAVPAFSKAEFMANAGGRVQHIVEFHDNRHVKSRIVSLRRLYTILLLKIIVTSSAPKHS